MSSPLVRSSFHHKPGLNIPSTLTSFHKESEKQTTRDGSGGYSGEALQIYDSNPSNSINQILPIPYKIFQALTLFIQFSVFPGYTENCDLLGPLPLAHLLQLHCTLLVMHSSLISALSSRLDKEKSCPGWVTPFTGVSYHVPKDCGGLNSWSGYIFGLQVASPVRAHRKGNQVTNWCFSLSSSLSLSLSLTCISKHILGWGSDKEKSCQPHLHKNASMNSMSSCAINLFWKSEGNKVHFSCTQWAVKQAPLEGTLSSVILSDFVIQVSPAPLNELSLFLFFF